MPVQEVGVRAIFETSSFSAGLNRYIAGLDKANKKTDEIVAALNAMAAHFNASENQIGANADKAAAALGRITTAAKEAMAAVRDSRSSGAATGESDELSDLQKQLEIQRQIKQEIKDRISEQKNETLLAARGISGLQAAAANAELEMIKLFRTMRDIGSTDLGVPEGTFERIRQMQLALSDLGNAPKTFTKDQSADLRILNEEVRDRIRLEQVINSLQNDRLTALQREKLDIEKIQIELAQRTRLGTASALEDSGLAASIRAIRKIPVEQVDIGGLTADETRLRINRLLSDEIRDRIRLQQISDQLGQAETSILQANLLQLEKQNIELNQQQRLNSALLTQIDQEAIARLRATQPTATDTGAQIDVLQQAVTQNRLISDELAAQLELKRVNLVLSNQESTVFEKEQASIARATLELEAQQRVLAATKVGLSQQALDDAKRVVIRPKDLGIEQVDPLQKAVALNTAIQGLLQTRLALEGAIVRSQDQELTEIQRTTAALEAGNLILVQQQKLAEFTKLGGDPAQLQAINSLLVTNADLNVNVNAQLEKQISAQRLLLEEVGARVELERQVKILQDGQSTALQRQAAQTRISQLALEAQVRTQKASDVGVGPDQLARIRATTVATRDLGEAQKDASDKVKQLSAATVVQATILSQFAVNTLRDLIQRLRQTGGAILDTVTSFERLGLGIGFFAAKAKFGTESTLTYQQRLAGVQDEVVGLQFWLQKLAVASPFTTKEVTQLFRTSQAYGLTQQEAEKLLPLMVDMGAAGGLDSDVMERLALALGQVRARGKLTGEEIRQLGNSGVPIRDILVKALGIANDQFDKLVEEGALTSDIVIPAIIKGLEQFRGAGEAVAFGTIGGLISGLQDLKEIATSKFFGAALDPLKASFKEFFDILNRPSTMATVQVLGKELGTELVADFKSLSNGVKELIKWLGALNPDVVAQVVTFTALSAIILTLAGGIGLLIAAIGLLSNPIIGISLLSAALLTEWTRMWRGLVNVTSSGARVVGGLLLDVAKFGSETALAWGRSFASAGKAISSLVSSIGSILAFWLKPGSPPRVAPQLDKWGRDAGEVWFDSIGQASPDKMVKGLTASVNDGLQEVSSRAIAAKLNLVPVVKQAFDATVPAAAAGGIAASEAYVDAFGSLVPKLHAKIDPELTKALSELGGGAELTLAGAKAFTGFIKGFKAADFSALDDAVGIVDNTLRALVERGAITEGDELRGLFGAREDIASALREFRKLGSISSSTLAKIVDDSGEAGTAVKDLLVAYTQFARADDTLTDAQGHLNQVTEKYNDILKPLKEQLERISELRQQSDEAQQIASLKRLIANEDVSEFRKQNARLKIQEILQQRAVRGVEKEQAAQTDTANEAVKAAQKKQDAAQKNLELVKAQIQAQQDQMSLFGQEAALVKKLRDQVDQLTKKQMTDLDLQEKLVELRAAELDDNKKAAKAKFVLNKADSTALERQAAIFDLQNVAIARQQRLVQARELGIPPEQLTSLRDMAVTLDDIGEKGDLGLGGDLDALAKAEVDAKQEAEKWNKELAQAQQNIDNIKLKLGEMFNVINDNLPTWLKIFPDKPGENPPIIDTIEKYSGAILGLGAIMVATNLVKGIATVVGLFGWLGGSARAIGTAIGAGGEVATGVGPGGVAEEAAAGIEGVGSAASGATGLLTSLGTVLFGVAAGLAAASAAAQGMGWLFDKFGVGQQAIQAGPFGPNVNDAILSLTRHLNIPSDQMGIVSALMQRQIADAFANGIKGGENNPQVTTDMQMAIASILQKGLVANTPENRAIFKDFVTQVGTILATQRPSGNPVNALAAVNVKNPTPKDLAEFGGTLQDTVTQVVNTGMAAGLDAAQIKKQVTTAINDGVVAGIYPDNAALLKAATDYLDALISAYQVAGKIQSPSLLTYEEVGEPLGSGILAGLADTLVRQEQAGSPISTTISAFLVFLRGAFLGSGKGNSIPYTLGSTWMQALAAGISSQQQTLTKALSSSLQGAMTSALSLVSLAPGASPLLANSPLVSRPSQIYPSGTQIINNVKYFNLNVTSSVASQGIIRDFGIMETMGT